MRFSSRTAARTASRRARPAVCSGGGAAGIAAHARRASVNTAAIAAAGPVESTVLPSAMHAIHGTPCVELSRLAAVAIDETVILPTPPLHHY